MLPPPPRHAPITETLPTDYVLMVIFPNHLLWSMEAHFFLSIVIGGSVGGGDFINTLYILAERNRKCSGPF